MHFSVLSRIISDSIKNDILLIKRLGAGKAIIEAKSADAANRLLSNSVFERNNLRAFIPSFKVLRSGIIRGVDQSISIDCIKENIVSKAKILDIQRLNRRVSDNGKTTYVPSRTISIKFAGQILPSEVVLFNVLYKVEAFVPKAKICYTCYRVGHIGRDYKSSRPRCLFCGSSCEEDHSCPADKSRATCINCGGEHLETSHTFIIKHKSVINLAAQENIPLIEARRIVSSHLSSSPTSQDISTDFKNYPYLPSKSSSPSWNTFKHSPQKTASPLLNRFQYLQHEDDGNHNH
ncbi:hypothetical protein ALC60_09636 [Trachymyrmex zeteki]|uniref:CCHC-type domain-containing protein n=1 Tax=Mycetomoellerius zeteki TaxID=64791 RepID=A0A151WTU7_9HYME|nr:hypothetical protein ALC60_09636 [Trachymyrmex zeteki]